MAKTAYSIYLDYQKAMKQADQLEGAAKIIRNERKNVQASQKSISAAWQGDNATKFIKKVNVVEEDLDSIAKNVQNAANVIRQIAKETYEAEQKALDLAKARQV